MLTPQPIPERRPAGRIVRFGVFELDLVAGELRKSGLRIRLQEQPFQVLALLLERPGDVVTREELRQKLWPADTFVDFDHGLNTAINKIYDHQSGDSVELEVRFPHQIIGFSLGGRRVDIEIHMPREGRVNLHTGDGRIRLSNFKGDMELRSGDGHQDVETVDGTLRAHAGDGHIRAAGRFDGLAITTGDGHIEVRALAGSRVGSSWDLHAGDGSVTLQLPADFAADVDLHTGDGHISLDLPVTVEGQLGKKNIHRKLNGGGNLLTIHTGDGSIRLEKS